jgi:hypothetical protein
VAPNILSIAHWKRLLGGELYDPAPYAHRRSPIVIAGESGMVVARPTTELFRHVCVESIEEEIDDDDDETRTDIEGLAADLGAAFPGYGVLLEPDPHPDRILWFAPDGTATLLWYEHEAVDRREPFSAWVAALFT